MKIIIAGGSGLIGRHLAHAFAAQGDEVVILSRSAATEVPGARSVEWSPGSSGAWVGELSGAHAIVNLCGESIGGGRWTDDRKRVLRESRLVPTRSLVEAIAELPPEERPGVLLSASGADVYEGLDAEPATEDTPPAETFLARLCLDWEAEAVRAEEFGVRVVSPRICPVIAAGALSLAKTILPFRLLLGGPLGSGEQWVSWVAIDDLVGLFGWAIEEDRVSGPLNIAAPAPVRQREQAQMLGRVLHRPSKVPAPAFAIRVVLGEQATLALGSRRVWPAKAVDLGYDFLITDLERALSEALRPTEPSSR